MEVLERTGDAPLTFEGELIAESDGKFAAGKEQNRWHDIRLYKTAGGNYVLAVEFHTQWQGELPFFFATQTSPEGIVEELRMFDPCSPVMGFPPGPQYSDRQQNLMDWIEKRFRNQVSEILKNCEELFETID